MFSHRADCMGTVFLFQIQDQIPDGELLRQCQVAVEILDQADETFSLYKTESEISRLVSGELSWDRASGVQRSVRDMALMWQATTAGHFNPRVGSDYDPSGLVKGWAAQNAAQYLEANGIRNFTLNAGGDIYLSSALEKSILTRVGLANLKPIAAEDAGVNLILELANTGYQAVATSGTAERGEHVWRSSSSSAFQQVTVVAKDLITADVWATALLSGGQSAWEIFCTAENDMLGFGVFEDGSMVASRGFSSLLGNH